MSPRSVHPAAVAVLRWPDDAEERARLAADSVPRLLLVAPDADPPGDLDDLEDWLRGPVEAGDLAARAETLRRRARANAAVPVLDRDGLLRHRGRWVAIPDSQLGVIRLLVERLGSLVRTEELVAAYAAAGGSTNRHAFGVLIVRLRSRVAELGLDLRVVRGRGVVLDLA